MKIEHRFAVLLSLVLLLSSCSSSDSPVLNLLPDSTGPSGEICIIIEDEDRKGAAGQYLQSDLLKPCAQFISFENQFGISTCQPENFSLLYKKFRNLILVDINDQPRNKKPWVDYKEDVWANDQLVIYIHAKDSTDFLNLYKEKSENIKYAINMADREKYQELQESVSDPVSVEKIRNKFGITMNMPSDYFLAADGKDHMWFKQEKLEYINNRGYQVVLNMLIRVEPFTNDSTFKDHQIIASADKITGQIIQNDFDNGLVLEKRFPPETKPINFNGNYGVELKGNWKFEHPLMGGPYTSLTLHDKANNRIITVEGFVFAPKFEKREYMKRLEALMYSMTY